jgi:excisionase family DNA binding protein
MASSADASGKAESASVLSSDGNPDVREPSMDLLTAKEVAALLRVTLGWVYTETRRDRIPHLRLGRYVRYRREALDAWMREIESYAGSPRQRPGRLRRSHP